MVARETAVSGNAFKLRQDEDNETNPVSSPYLALELGLGPYHVSMRTMKRQKHDSESFPGER